MSEERPETPLTSAEPAPAKRSVRAGCLYVAVAGVISVVAATYLFMNSGKAHNQCFDENTSCIAPGPGRTWLGRVYTRSGQPASFATVDYFLDGSNGPTRVRTDRAGRFCIRWTNHSDGAGAVAVTAWGIGRPSAAYARLGRKFRGPVIVTPDAAMVSWPSGEINGGGITQVGWESSADSTNHCLIAGPPWYNLTNLESTWQFFVLAALPIAAIAFAIGGAISRRFGAILLFIAILACVSEAVLYHALWAGAVP